jgi:gamma-glutamylcyclotransferase (GGCT)/AIG2-like uncharacterized protein YtfP
MQPGDMWHKGGGAMLYAAYGSNLNMEQMAYRCPGAKVVGTAMIPNYRLMFKGSKTGSYLTIERERGCKVPVGIWEVSGDDIKALDRYEGFPTFYYKKSFILPCSDGKRHRVMAYIMHEDRPIGIPSSWYVDGCFDGYDAFGFDHSYLCDALEYSERGGVA